jgi:hypothetical protein
MVLFPSFEESKQSAFVRPSGRPVVQSCERLDANALSEACQAFFAFFLLFFAVAVLLDKWLIILGLNAYMRSWLPPSLQNWFTQSKNAAPQQNL